MSSLSSIYRIIGLWSEVILGKIHEEIFFLSNNREICTRNRSNLEEMFAAPNLLFVHVYLIFFGLNSISSHVKMIFSTNFNMGSLPYTPPDFSFVLIIIFKSPPTIIFEKELASRKAANELPQSLFS